MNQYEALDAKELEIVEMENRINEILGTLLFEQDPSKVTELSQAMGELQLEHAGLQQEAINMQESILANARAGDLNVPPYVQGYKEMRTTLEEWSNTSMDAQTIALNARHDLAMGAANQPSLTGDNDLDRIITEEFDRGQNNAILDWSSEQQQALPQEQALDAVVAAGQGRYKSEENKQARRLSEITGMSFSDASERLRNRIVDIKLDPDPDMPKNEIQQIRMAAEEIRNSWQAQGYSLESVVVNVLGERYASVKDEMAEVAANTPAEAVAATNYFHGRVDELNQIRAAVVWHDQSLGAKIPTMTTDEIKIGYEEEESTGHEMGMSV